MNQKFSSLYKRKIKHCSATKDKTFVQLRKIKHLFSSEGYNIVMTPLLSMLGNFYLEAIGFVNNHF